MLNPQTVHHHNAYPSVTQTLRPCWEKPFLSGNNGSSGSGSANSLAINSGKIKAGKNGVSNISKSRRAAPKSIVKVGYGTSMETITRVKVTVSVIPKIGGLKETLLHGADDIVDVLGAGVFLELVAAELDPCILNICNF